MRSTSNDLYKSQEDRFEENKFKREASLSKMLPEEMVKMFQDIPRGRNQCGGYYGFATET